MATWPKTWARDLNVGFETFQTPRYKYITLDSMALPLDLAVLGFGAKARW